MTCLIFVDIFPDKGKCAELLMAPMTILGIFLNDFLLNFLTSNPFAKMVIDNRPSPGSSASVTSKQMSEDLLCQSGSYDLPDSNMLSVWS